MRKVKAEIFCYLTGRIKIIASVFDLPKDVMSLDSVEIPNNVNAIAWDGDNCFFYRDEGGGCSCHNSVLAYIPEPYSNKECITLSRSRDVERCALAMKLAATLPPLRQTWVEFSGG